MKITTSNSVCQQKSDSKERKTTSGKNFHELMAAQKLPHRVQRKQSVFDMAGKREEKSSRSKKEIKEGGHHGAIQKELSSDGVIEARSTVEVVDLSPEMHELMEKMALLIKVESQNGVSTTTVFVEMEGSLFNGSQIVIDHYDTAPQSFNLQLGGSSEAVDLFTANLAALRTSLQAHESLRGFQIQLFPPILSEKSDLHLRGKGKEKKIHKKPVLGKKISF